MIRRNVEHMPHYIFISTADLAEISERRAAVYDFVQVHSSDAAFGVQHAELFLGRHTLCGQQELNRPDPLATTPDLSDPVLP